MRRGNRRRTRSRGGVLGARRRGRPAGHASPCATAPERPEPGLGRRWPAPSAPPRLERRPPEVGLGYGQRHHGALRRLDLQLSTAPGPYDGSDVVPTSTLYRSDDGTEWMRSAPSRAVRRSATRRQRRHPLRHRHRASRWQRPQVSVAAERTVARRGRRTCPRRWRTSSSPPRSDQPRPAAIAARRDAPGGHLHRDGHLDPTTYRDDIPDNAGWESDDTGVKIYEPAGRVLVPGDDGCQCRPDDDRRRGHGRRQRRCRGGRAREGRGSWPTAVAAPSRRIGGPGTYTWDELGVPADLQAYIGGQTFAYVTEDGTSFERVDVPRATGVVELQGDPHARRLPPLHRSSTKDASSTGVLRSEDGLSWVQDTVLDGGLNSAGLLGDRPAVSIWSIDGTSNVKVQQADGAWSTLDLASAIEPPAGHAAWVGEVSFGPLGVAATVPRTSRGRRSGARLPGALDRRGDALGARSRRLRRQRVPAMPRRHGHAVAVRAIRPAVTTPTATRRRSSRRRPGGTPRQRTGLTASASPAPREPGSLRGAAARDRPARRRSLGP